LGEIDPRIAESLGRIRSSADQLLTLVAGLGEAAVENVDSLYVDVAETDIHELLSDIVDSIMPEATARGTTLTLENTDAAAPFFTDPERLERALVLTLHAAIKASAGAPLRFVATTTNQRFHAVLTGMTASVEDADVNAGVMAATSALTLRLAMAAQAIRPLNGALVISPGDGGMVLTITVPRSPLAD
ncbi:MAG: hypothetical protein ABIS27_13190, partial [Longimicrobiales bacterium]